MSMSTSTSPDSPPRGPIEAVLRANDLSDPGLRLGIAAALGDSGFEERDRYGAFGWEVDPSAEEYVGLYLRNPYGGGLIDKAAQLAWRHDPEIQEAGEDAPEESAFEEAVEKLGRAHDLWAYCARVHKAAGFGEFALLFINFDDVDDLDALDTEPEYEDGDLDNIRGFRVVPQMAVDEVEHGNFNSERWGDPEYYTIDWGDDLNDDLDDEAAASRVHHSRVVEVPSKPPLAEEYSSRPRMERILNTLYDIEKLLGSAAEMSYRGADKGLHINYDPSKVNPESLDTDEERENIQRWLHGLQPTFNTVGAEVNDLGGEIRDPTGALEAELKSLSAATGFSKQFIEGAAAGEIASSETNMRNDFGEIRERQTQYVTPYIVRRALGTLQAAGVLSRPATGGFDVHWPDLFELSDSEEADVEQTRAQTAKAIGLMGDAAQEYVKTGAFPDNDVVIPNAVDESNPAVANQFDALTGGDSSDGVGRRDVLDHVGNATRLGEGDPVQTPQGFGVVAEVRTEEFEGKDGSVEASESSPTYVVALKDASVGVGFYSASELSQSELPETDVDDPADDLASQSANSDGVADRVLQALNLRSNDWTMPESWRESDTPARVILLKAWAGMNGQFDCGGGCCKGEMLSSGMSERGANQFCAAMKDEVLQWEGWRN